MKKAAAAPLPEEAAYLARARQGDKNAYRYIVEGYQDRVYRIVLSIVPKTMVAEDLTQEIFIKAYFALPSFQGQSAFFTWIFRIASNHCLDHLRKRRLPETSLDQPTEDGGDQTLAEQLVAPPSEAPEAPSEKTGALSSLLQGLDPDQRLILTLRELEGYSYEQLAETLECRVNTVKSRLNRARSALKAAFSASAKATADGLARRSSSSRDRAKAGEGGNIQESKIVQKSGEKA